VQSCLLQDTMDKHKDYANCFGKFMLEIKIYCARSTFAFTFLFVWIIIDLLKDVFFL
jgi:hypothetical protein